MEINVKKVVPLEKGGRLHDTISRFVILLDVVYLVVSVPLRDSLFLYGNIF